MNLSNTQEHAIKNSIASVLFKLDIVTPRQALAVGVVFSESVNLLLESSIDFKSTWKSAILDVEIDGKDANIDADNVFAVLVESDFIDNLLGTEVLVAGKRLLKILDMDIQSYAPALATEGVNRRFDYTKKTDATSSLYVEAIHALESTEFEVSLGMLRIAKRVLSKVENTMKEGDEKYKLIKSQEFVIKGSAAMTKDTAYVSEFSGDPRGRLYQSACYGPNGQSSDLARAMMNLSGVSTDYDTDAVIGLLVDEMNDMGDADTLEDDMVEAVANPVDFIVTHLKKELHISKPWNFVKFANLVTQLRAGKKPYIGVAVGLDAKASGPQLGALQVGDTNMMQMTGLTQVEVEDAYMNAIKECKKMGITTLTRALVKKPFMSIFYGASKASMLDMETITEKTYDALYCDVGSNPEAMENIAERLYDAINSSFGGALRKVRTSFKNAGYDYDMEEVKYDNPVTYNMPDGFNVQMDYKVKLDLDGNEVGREKVNTTCVINTLNGSTYCKNATFKSDTIDLAKYARTGYVNMIQATDALLARLVIVNAHRSGAQHIIAVHDCFRVNIHDMAILKGAIQMAYHELFGAKKNVKTENLPLGTDILGLYFKGNKDATKNKYKAAAPCHSQFYRDGNRNFSSINGNYFKNIINSLSDENLENRATYFAK